MIRKLSRKLSLILAFCMMLTCINPNVAVVYAQELADTKVSGTYYISSTQGDDANDGLSPETPWRTLDKVNNTSFEPGTEILFKRGDHWNGDLYIDDSGAPGQMIVLKPYGEGTARPVINGTGVPNKDANGNLLWQSGSAAILVRDAEYIRIEGLGITNMGVDKEGNPNKVEDLANGKNEKLRSGIAIVQVRSQEDKVLNKIELVDNEIYHVKGVSLRELGESQDGSEDGNMYNNAGIYFHIEGANNLGITRIDDLLIENNYIHDTSCMGIHTQPQHGGGGYNSNPSAYSTNVRILGNHIARTGADGIIVGYTDKVLVERNVSYDAGATSTGNRVRVIAGIWPYNSYDSVFQYNECARTRFDRGDGMAWDADWGTAGDLIYQYNYSHENEGGTLMDCNTTDVHNWIHRYNLSVNEPGAQWTITSHEIGKIEFYNNTVYIAPGGGRMKIYAPHVPEVRMYNNIFVADQGDYTEFNPAGNAFVNNIVVGHEGPEFGKNTIISDPQFVDVTAAEVEKVLNNEVYLKTPGALDGWDKIEGWQLKSNSPAINRGLPVVNNSKIPAALAAKEDIMGNPVAGQGFDGTLDIGAFEYQGAYTGDGQVAIAPMAASHGVEVEFATHIAEGIVADNLDGVNYALTNIQDGDTIAFDRVKLDKNAGIMIAYVNVLADTTVEVKIGDQVVGSITFPATNGYETVKVRLDEEVAAGIYPVQLTFRGAVDQPLMAFDSFRLIPGRQGAVDAPYTYTFEENVEGWRPVTSGEVAVANGKLKLTSAGIYTSDLAPEVQDGIVEAEITPGPNHRTTLLFRYDELTGQYIEVGFDVGNYWFIGSEGLGISQQQLDASKCPTVVEGETYTVKVKYEGNHLQVFIDGVEVLNQTFAGNTPTTGIVGARKWQNNASYVTYLDNIRINCGTISGQVVLEATNEPVAGVPVSLEGTVYSTTTDANGCYVFNTVPLDKAYTVVVEGKTQEVQVSLAQDEVIANIALDNGYVNKEQLIATVNQAKALEKALYTAESWENVQVAITVAEEVIADATATAATVQQALTALEQAITDLVIKQKEAPYKYTFDKHLEGWTSEQAHIQLAISNGKLQVKSTAMPSTITRDIAGPSLTDAVITYEVQPETAANGGHQRSTFVIKHDLASGAYIAVGFDTNNYWFVEVNGTNYANFTNAPTVVDGETYTIKAKVLGDQVTVWIDGEQCFDQTITGVGALTGQPGVKTWNPTVVNYDNIAINFGCVTGQVVDGTDAPVVGVEVALSNGQTTTTDTNGQYVFEEVPLDKTYTVSVKDMTTRVRPTVSNDVYVAETIQLVSVVIESIEDILVEVEQNEVYVLPTTVVATLSNLETVDLPVAWNGIADTTVPGIYTFEGTVEGYEPKVSLTLEVIETVIIEEIIAFEDLEATVQQGDPFYLPRTVQATMNTTTSQAITIAWVGVNHETNEVDTTIPGEYTFVGTPVDYISRVKASFKLIVTPKEEAVFGSYVVSYVDKDGNVLLPSKIESGLTLGKYEEYAPIIEGYDLVGNAREKINLTANKKDQEITFVYKEAKVKPNKPKSEIITEQE